jgi:hypothetical protein
MQQSKIGLDGTVDREELINSSVIITSESPSPIRSHQIKSEGVVSQEKISKQKCKDHRPENQRLDRQKERSNWLYAMQQTARRNKKRRKKTTGYLPSDLCPK